MKTNKHKKIMKEMLAELASLNNKVAEYKDDLLSMTTCEVSDMYQEQHDLHEIIQNVCVHDDVTLYKGYWTDCGYGLDRTYDGHTIQCNVCNSRILDECERGYTPLIENVSLEKAQQYIGN